MIVFRYSGIKICVDLDKWLDDKRVNVKEDHLQYDKVYTCGVMAYKIASKKMKEKGARETVAFLENMMIEIQSETELFYKAFRELKL